MEPLQYLIDEMLTRDCFEITIGHQPQNAFFVIYEGSFFCQFTGAESFVAEAGDLVCFPMHSRFTRRVIEPCTFHLIYFTTNNHSASTVVLPQGKIHYEDIGRYHSNCKNFRQLLTKTDEMSRCLRNHLLNDFYLQYCMENRPSADSSLIISDQINCVIEYFTQHLADPVTLNDVASVARLSPNGLIRRFRAETGYSPMQYFSHLRLVKARDALVHTTIRIGDIAEMCGFDNIYYFSSTFKKKYGIPPSDVRKAAQQV